MIAARLKNKAAILINVIRLTTYRLRNNIRKVLS